MKENQKIEVIKQFFYDRIETSNLSGNEKKNWISRVEKVSDNKIYELYNDFLDEMNKKFSYLYKDNKDWEYAPEKKANDLNEEPIGYYVKDNFVIGNQYQDPKSGINGKLVKIQYSDLYHDYVGVLQTYVDPYPNMMYPIIGKDRFVSIPLLKLKEADKMVDKMDKKAYDLKSFSNGITFEQFLDEYKTFQLKGYYPLYFAEKVMKISDPELIKKIKDYDEELKNTLKKIDKEAVLNDKNDFVKEAVVTIDTPDDESGLKRFSTQIELTFYVNDKEHVKDLSQKIKSKIEDSIDSLNSDEMFNNVNIKIGEVLEF